MSITKAQIALIEATGNPLAPKIAEEVHTSLGVLGRMLAALPQTEQGKCELFTDKMLASWTNKQQNEIAKDPNFALALAGMLSEALVAYIRGLN